MFRGFRQISISTKLKWLGLDSDVGRKICGRGENILAAIIFLESYNLEKYMTTKGVLRFTWMFAVQWDDERPAVLCRKSFFRKIRDVNWE